jgi:3-oxoacyl-[acyl-carrier protein] reductase
MNGCAVVTGGSRGIGAATAASLALAGRRTAVVYRSDEEGGDRVVAAIRAEGGTALAVRADVSDVDDIEAAFAQIEEALGPIAVLVNNAGVRADGLAVDMSDSDWDDVVSVNLSAAFRCSRRVLRPMIRARHGRIVNVSSVIATRGNAGQANYAASKGGLIAMTRSMAVEVARRNITVNAVAPGFIPTRLTQDVQADAVGTIPARRAGTPQEVAACIVFLASDEASYVTGTTLTVDGGLSA